MPDEHAQDHRPDEAQRPEDDAVEQATPVEPVEDNPEDAVGDDGVRRDLDLPDDAVPAGDEIEQIEGQARKQAAPAEPGYSLQQAYEGNLDAEDAAARGIDLVRLDPDPDDEDEVADEE